MDRTELLGRLAKIDALPTFPGIVSALIERIEDPRSSASDLARYMDPALAGEVLRVANTAYFGTGSFRDIRTVERAIAVIGYEHLSHTILQMPFLAMVPGTDRVFDKNGYVRHSITCGVICRTIASVEGRVNPAELYVSGLMHDVGIVVLYRYFREEWDRVLGLMEGHGLSRMEAEREVLSFDHGGLGAELLDLWSIPKAITDGVRFHHDPAGGGENTPTAVITHLGNLMAKTIDFNGDMSGFDDFLHKHRTITGFAKRFGKELAPSQEVEVLETLYLSLKGVREYTDAMTEGKDDEGTHS